MDLFYLHRCTNLGYIFNYMKEGCRLEVKFSHRFLETDKEPLEVICKSKYWFKKDHFLEDEDGNFPEWALSEKFNDRVLDLFGHIGYLCMIDEIKNQYLSFAKEKELDGKNYEMIYKYRFIPQDLNWFIKNIRTGRDVVQNDYSEKLENFLKSGIDIENYVLRWKEGD